MLKVLLSTLLLTTAVYAADEAPKAAEPAYQEAGNMFAGASVGVAKIANIGSNIPLRVGYGAEFSYVLMKELAVGVFASRNDGEISKGSNVDFTLTKIGAEVLYSPIPDAILSLKAGIGLAEVSTKVLGARLSQDAEPFFIAPGLGMIFPITNQIQFVPNISYAYFFKNSDMGGKFNAFDAMGTFRFKF